MGLEKRDRKDKPSKVEQAKLESHYLRGTIHEILNDPQAGGFEHDDYQLLKFHGMYQGEDRDAKSLARVTGQEQPKRFMIRLKVPGGRLTPQQYMAMDQLADEVTYNASLRITTRQTFQLHGVLKGDLKKTMQHIHSTLLTTVCGCGDVERNIMAPPVPIHDPPHDAVRKLTDDLAGSLVPNSNAYFEIWLDGEKIDTSQEQEDLYGPTYLPRKFKTGIALPGDNSADVFTQDVGLIAIVDDAGELLGANVLVGGGLGMTHKKPETYARLGTQLGFVEPDNLVRTVQTIATIHRDFGDRTDRRHARLKYIVEEQGIDAFRDEFHARVDFQLKPWIQTQPLEHRNWLGRYEQGDGKWFYGLFIPNGRIIDRETPRFKTAIKTIVQTIECDTILTPNQNIIFADLEEDDLAKIEKVLAAYNVTTSESLSQVVHGSMACPALPTCALALTEAERVMGDVAEDLERVFAEFGLDDVPIAIRMTGCPNGCARPYTADIGLVGHKPGHYDVFLGGSRHGHRMAELYSVNVPMQDLATKLRPLIERFAAERQPDEEFGEFYNRVFADGAHRHLATGDRDTSSEARVEAAIGT